MATAAAASVRHAQAIANVRRAGDHPGSGSSGIRLGTNRTGSEASIRVGTVPL